MTSLLGRLLRLFPESVPLEDLFTEAVAHLFEKRPQLCLAWLREAGLVNRSAAGDGQERVRVVSQRTYAALDNHGTDSRPDLLIEVYRPLEEPTEDGALSDVVMIESKIGSKEGQEQLRRYAEHLGTLTDFGGTALAYITRGYDPKDSSQILSGLNGNVCFKQLRWYDFYRFLQTADKDALVEEVMSFMEEQRMATTYRFSVADLVALSGLPRALEILDETLGGEVKAEVESFTKNKVRDERTSLRYVREEGEYLIVTPLTPDGNLYCYAGYALSSEYYPTLYVALEVNPRLADRAAWMIFIRRVALREDWEGDLADPDGWAGVWRERNLADVLPAEDHVAAVKHFFIESIRQLRGELVDFKKERPDLPWDGGSVALEES